MSIRVTSEIGRLKKVLLHRPGAELEHLVPTELEALLFDDIPYLKVAQEEHDYFAKLLKAQGVEVCYLEDLMADVLRSNPELKPQFIKQFVSEGGANALLNFKAIEELLSSIKDEKDLVETTMSGVTERQLMRDGGESLINMIRTENHFVLKPIPNLYFTRDPFTIIGGGISVHRMHSKTRRRETIYGEYILKHHPDFKDVKPIYYDRNASFHIEGGDILNLGKKVIAVGVSQRTSPLAVELLAKNIFADPDSEIRTVLAMHIPGIRAYMHLDTVFTQIDRNKFLVHPGVMDSLRVFKITPNGDDLSMEELSGSFEDILSENLEVDDVRLIKCGGGNSIAAEREQWNDGSNTLCVRPGTVIVYNRNYVTNSILEYNGIEVLEMPSSELSRGRGGPHCMSMPLLRDEL